MSIKSPKKSFGAQFKGLNTKDPSSWPGAPKFVFMLSMAAAILAGAYLADWQSQMEELEEGQRAELQLKQEYKDKYAQAINLDLYRAQLSEVNTLLVNMLRQLPNKSQMEALITDINNAGLGRGLQFELFRPATQETKKEVYAELPIAIRVTGSYHNMGMFAADIGQISRIVTLNDINIAAPPAAVATGKGAAPAGSEILVMEATAKTFRYLDDAELAEIRQAKAAAKKK